MDDAALEDLVNNILEGLTEDKKDLIKKLVRHTDNLRSMVGELSEGLEEESLLDQVNELLGADE
jgi:hypothetical protein